MADLLVALYRLPSEEDELGSTRIRRAMSYERSAVVRYIEQTFNSRWASEAEVAFSSHPIRCYIALQAGKLCGFSCYDATLRGFFGPMGVSAEQKGKGVGRGLLLAALGAMREVGYAYAIIGGVGDAMPFYERVVGAQTIDDSEPGAYEYDLYPMATPSKHDSVGQES